MLNNLHNLRPELISEWDYNNNTLIPEDLSEYSHEKVHWICKNKHKWTARVSTRSEGHGCPICAGIVIGPSPTYENSIWASEYKEHMSRYLTEEQMKTNMPGSNKKVKAKCPECGFIKSIQLSKLIKEGFTCPQCGDGISYPNKFVRSIFNQLDIEYKPEYRPLWSEGKIYDIGVESLSLVVEIHGMQHYNGPGFASVGGRTLQEEKNNDEYKQQLALQNGINNYIIIDARFSNKEWIKKSIMQSSLPDILSFSEQDINWDECAYYATNSMARLMADDWNRGLQIKNISKKYKISQSTVRKYLKQMSTLGLCNNKDG